MKTKLILATATALAVACSAWLGCDAPHGVTASDLAELNQRWMEAVTNTARSYFRLGVASGDKVNLLRAAGGQAGVSGTELWREAVKVAGDDAYLKAP